MNFLLFAPERREAPRPGAGTTLGSCSFQPSPASHSEASDELEFRTEDPAYRRP